MSYTNNDPDEQERILSEALQRLTITSALQWQKIVAYLSSEEREGKTEFRIALQGNRKFIVHPLSKDGKTINMEY